MIAYLALIVGEIEAGFAALFAFELRTVSTALKERAKRLAEIKKRLIRSIFRDLPRPRELLAPDVVKLLLELEGRGVLALLILAVPRELSPSSTQSAQFRQLWQSTQFVQAWDAV